MKRCIIGMTWVCGLLLVTSNLCYGQAITQPESKSFFRFEQLGSGIASAINDVKQFNNAVLLGSNGVFIRSLDAGKSWIPVLSQLQHKNINAIVTHDSVIVVGTATGGLYRTTDAGLYWTRFGVEPRLLQVRHLLRTRDGYVATNTNGACFQRRDTDTVWQELALPAPCQTLAVFDGKTWMLCENGSIISADGDKTVVKLNIKQALRATMVPMKNFLAVVLDSSVLVLDDDADSVGHWPMPIQDWTICDNQFDELLVGGRATGLKRLNIETGVVTSVFAGPSEVENISALAVAGDTIVIGTNRGGGRCYVVTEGSTNWHALNPFWLRGAFDATSISYTNGRVLVATRQEGVHAGTVSKRTLLPIHDAYENSIFSQIEPWRDEMLIVSRRAGILRLKKADGRTEWLTHSLPASHEYSATAIGDRLLVSIDSGRILKSDTDGRSWSQSPDVLPSINRLNAFTKTILASTVSGLYRSTDEGDTWKNMDGPLSGLFIDRVSGTDDTIFVMSQNVTYMYIEGQGFTKLEAEADIRTEPRAKSVTEPQSEPELEKRFTSMISRGGHIFGTGVPGVYLSADLGKTWQLHLIPKARAIAAQFFYNDIYFVLTERGDLWRSPVP